MALNDVLARAFKEVVTADSRLVALLPGDVHYGRADTSATRPFAAIVVAELSREYDSGWAALVQYEITMTVYGKQRARDVGGIMRVATEVFGNGGWLQMILPDDLGFVLSMTPGESSLAEDDTEEFGKDVMVGRQKWLLLVNEYEMAAGP